MMADFRATYAHPIWLRLTLALALSAASGVAASEVLDIPTPYLPSTRLNVDEMLRLAAVGPQDVVIDLGSGDGQIGRAHV